MEKFEKVTHGWVNQTFVISEDDDFHCTEQSFFAGDTVEYEDAKLGDPLSISDQDKAVSGEIYQPFDMVQPTMVHHNLIVVGDVEPELSEPFESWDEMISAAEQHREKDPEQKDGIYHLTVPKGVRIEIDTYCGARE